MKNFWQKIDSASKDLLQHGSAAVLFRAPLAT